LRPYANGRFDEFKATLEALAFEFKETKDPTGCIFTVCLGRTLSSGTRNLYRQHGSRRSLDRISRHDQGQAKQMIDTLRGVIGSSQDNGGDDQ
jgi:hypothetical protein